MGSWELCVLEEGLGVERTQMSMSVKQRDREKAERVKKKEGR